MRKSTRSYRQKTMRFYIHCLHLQLFKMDLGLHLTMLPKNYLLPLLSLSSRQMRFLMNLYRNLNNPHLLRSEHLHLLNPKRNRQISQPRKRPKSQVKLLQAMTRSPHQAGLQERLLAVSLFHHPPKIENANGSHRQL